MERIALGKTDLHVTPIGLGTMTFGEQVDEATAHDILDRALERGIDFIDTAEMYPVPARAETYGATEALIGRWLASRPGARARVVLATKAVGPARNMPWLHQGSRDLTAAQIVRACDGSLRRLQTDVIDLYQIHWPNRNVPMFGGIYFDPAQDGECSSIQSQLEALAGLVKAGKVRQIGISNETPYGVAEFVRVAEQHGLPRIATVQNSYSLVNRALETGLDETMYRLGVSLVVYSPLAFGLLTGKYDGPEPDARGRMEIYASMKSQRWGRPAARAAARRYNALAREHGLTPTRMALAWCFTKWQTASTLLGVTTRGQLDEDIDAWGTTLAPDLLAAIDAVRWELRDPAQ